MSPISTIPDTGTSLVGPAILAAVLIVSGLGLGTLAIRRRNG